MARQPDNTRIASREGEDGVPAATNDAFWPAVVAAANRSLRVIVGAPGAKRHTL